MQTYFDFLNTQLATGKLSYETAEAALQRTYQVSPQEAVEIAEAWIKSHGGEL